MQIYKQPISITGTDATFHGSLTLQPLQEGITLVNIQIDAKQKAYPPVIRVEWSHPAVDIQRCGIPAMPVIKHSKSIGMEAFSPKAPHLHQLPPYIT